MVTVQWGRLTKAAQRINNTGNVTGHHGSDGTYDYWLVKLDALENIVWEKSCGGTGGDIAFNVQKTPDL